MLHEPAGGLGTEEDPKGEDEGWDTCRAELKSPSDGARVFDNDIGAEAQEDPCSDD